MAHSPPEPRSRAKPSTWCALKCQEMLTKAVRTKSVFVLVHATDKIAETIREHVTSFAECGSEPHAPRKTPIRDQVAKDSCQCDADKYSSVSSDFRFRARHTSNLPPQLWPPLENLNTTCRPLSFGSFHKLLLSPWHLLSPFHAIRLIMLSGHEAFAAQRSWCQCDVHSGSQRRQRHLGDCQPRKSPLCPHQSMSLWTSVVHLCLVRTVLRRCDALNVSTPAVDETARAVHIAARFDAAVRHAARLLVTKALPNTHAKSAPRHFVSFRSHLLLSLQRNRSALHFR